MNNLGALGKTRFAFLIHGREASDFGHLVGQKLGIGENLGRRLFPDSLSRQLWKGLRRCRPVVVCSRFEVSPEVEGFVIGLPTYAAEMLALPRKQMAGMISDAVVFAQDELGCSVVGLGAYTAPLSRNGIAVAEDSRVSCAVTHGDALSAASAVQAVGRVVASQKKEMSQLTIAVVGAYGLVGRAAAIMISELGPARMILTGPNANKLQKVAVEMVTYSGEIVCTTDNGEVRAANIVVLCTTANGDVVGRADLKEHAVVIDMAQPPNLTRKICQMRPDIRRIDGGSLRTGVDPGFNMGMPEGATLACFTETMLLAQDGESGHHVGVVDLEYTRQIWQRALAHGYDLAPPTSFGKAIENNAYLY
jgi:predicted amino acid dehydrogenase